ncbi:MAG: bacterial Ig-like domain-containing protein [Clostridia bacterium]|nr:bacterial Ig-like domain-containing protein [Clostridia bacterium]
MKTLTIHKDVVYALFDDDTFRNEMTEFLNRVIDAELKKGDAMDCDLIDACAEVLLELQTETAESAQTAFVLLSDENFCKQIQKHSLLRKKRQRILAVSAAAALLLLTVGSVYSRQTTGETLTKRMEQKIAAWFESERVETPELPTAAEETTDAPTTPTTAPETTTEAETEPATVKSVAATAPAQPQETLPTRIYGVFPDDLKTEYQVGEALDMRGVRVIAVETDGTERELPLSDCQVTTERGFSRDPGRYTVTVFYRGLSFSYSVTVVAQKDTVILNSIYGTFPEGFSFTVTSFDDLDLNGLTVTAVYSDGSEREIPLSDCEITVEPNFMELENKALVTVNYEDRTFSFILTKEAE